MLRPGLFNGGGELARAGRGSQVLNPPDGHCTLGSFLNIRSFVGLRIRTLSLSFTWCSSKYFQMCSPVLPLLGTLPRFAFPSTFDRTTEIVGQVDSSLAKFPTDKRPPTGSLDCLAAKHSVTVTASFIPLLTVSKYKITNFYPQL